MSQTVIRKVSFIRRANTLAKPQVSLVPKGAEIYCIYRGDRKAALETVKDVFIALSRAVDEDTLEPGVTLDTDPVEFAARQL